MIVKAFAAFGSAIMYLLCLFAATSAFAFLSDMGDDDSDIYFIANIIQAVIVILFLWERILK